MTYFTLRYWLVGEDSYYDAYIQSEDRFWEDCKHREWAMVWESVIEGDLHGSYYLNTAHVVRWEAKFRG